MFVWKDNSFDRMDRWPYLLGPINKVLYLKKLGERMMETLGLRQDVL